MSQYSMNPGMYAEENFTEAPRTSGLAIAALVCALLFCLPAVPLLGVLLGLLAVVTMIGKTSMRGRGLAIAAIVIGLVITAVQAAGGWWFYQFSRQFVVLFRDSPVQMMQAGYAGDYTAFRSHLLGPATQADDASIRAFVDEVRGRWGGLVSMEMKPNQRQQTSPPTGGNASTADVEYTASFDSATVPVVIEFRFEPGPGAGGSSTGGGSEFLKMGISSITFQDRDRGDIRFPILPKPPRNADEARTPEGAAGTP